MTMSVRGAAAGVRRSALLALGVTALGCGIAGVSVASAATSTSLTRAEDTYHTWVKANVAGLVSASGAMCKAISSGSLTAAREAYPKARVFYEKIEPVAGTFGVLDTKIDGRWENPVTVKSQFIGFHRIEQLLFQDKTLKGTATLCSGLVANEQQLVTLVAGKKFTPLTMAAGATDLVNEAATSKITGEEERYSHTDLNVIGANLEGANEVVQLFAPYLKAHDAALLKTLDTGYANAITTLKTFSGDYDGTAYVDYSTVSSARRRVLSQALNAYAESLSKLSPVVH